MPPAERVGGREREVAERDYRQRWTDQPRERDTCHGHQRGDPDRASRRELTGRDGPLALSGMKAVVLDIANVIDQIGSARQQAERGERTGNLRRDSRTCQRGGGGWGD